MPELPEIETLNRQLQKIVLGHTIKDVTLFVSALRSPVPETIRTDIINQKIENIERYGKFLQFRLSNNKNLLIHLGMTGQLLIIPCDTKNDDSINNERHLRAIFTLDNSIIKFKDIRKFGLIDTFTDQPNYIAHLGIDPLSEKFNVEYLFNLTRDNNKTIKFLLLDQKKISGIGNIYANEALFDAGIDPIRKSSTLTRAECIKAVKSIKTTLNTAIDLGGTSMKDYVHLDGKKGHYQDHFLIYSKQGTPCPRCGKAILKKKIDGRSSFFCTNCQK